MSMTTVVFLVLNVVGISSIVYLLLRFAAVERKNLQLRLEEAHRLLQSEQERSERLLLNIVPGPVAERLKMEDGTIADGFADVTVMFANIVNFTVLAEGLTPNQVFAMLDRVFSSFDALAEKHGLEKIKTIGDTYMVAGGLYYDESTINYSEAIANMALEIRAVLAKDLAINEHRLEIHTGIATGPVVGGVVGKKKFIYDLWGDTVNVASHITAETAPGMIQVDFATYRHLRNKFEFEPPKTIYLKGKGATDVYPLLRRKETATSEATDSSLAAVDREPGERSVENAPDLFRRLEQINEIGAALSVEKDLKALLEKILLAAKTITRADGGTLYLVEGEGAAQVLRFEIVRTASLAIAMGGTTGNAIPFHPIHLFKDGDPNTSMVAAFAALSGQTVNIADAYTEQGFDFSGTRAFDKKTGYRSQSFLTVPMKNHEGEIIGVLELTNCQNPATGEIVAFSTSDQRLAESLASQAAIALTNR